MTLLHLRRPDKTFFHLHPLDATFAILSGTVLMLLVLLLLTIPAK